MKLCFQPIRAVLFFLLTVVYLPPSMNADNSMRLTIEQKNVADKFLPHLEIVRPGKIFEGRKSPGKVFQLWGKGMEALLNR